MIRTITQKDFDEILSLWNTSFGEEKDFTKWYFEKMFNPQNFIVFEENGEIISMLQRLPYTANNIGKVSYIYGACTHPKYRGKGIMEKLIDYSKTLDMAEGVSASILIPQEESLFGYYARFGYEPAFYLNKITQEYQKADESYQIKIAENSDIDTLKNLYNTVLEGDNFITRDGGYFEILLDLFKTLAGECFVLLKNSKERGYAFCSRENQKIYVQEIVCADEIARANLLNLIMQKYDVAKIEAFELSAKKSSAKLGSAYFYDEKIKAEIKANLLFN